MSTSNIKSILDPTDFSDASAGLDLYGNMIRESHHYDAFGGKTRFHARVLSVPIPMDSAGFRVDSAMGSPPAPGTAGSYLSKAIGFTNTSPGSTPSLLRRLISASRGSFR